MKDIRKNITVTCVCYALLFVILIVLISIKNQATMEPEPVDEFPYVTQHLEEAEERLDSMPEETYILSATERDLIEGVVSAEAADHDFFGKALVAQCIRNACEIDEIRPEKALEVFRYAKPRNDVADGVVEAVSAVFDEGFQVTELPILYFYSTAGGFKSEWHETQEYVLSYEDHRFFMRKEKK